ncbi:Protein DOWNSTREAM OF FLC like [Actinidia chinensis var. chinensis]|uniref:Protein DOWNSTREAM OF FLC like n=1 Tax=Actinidia chinensis var. chinensis TaxID=1590841 RepID=A0A2R6QYF7_ACTCC|nr:Protein DOWNSTREAM OF FLC like [Actinidia chinensis var. chinensis]
MARLMLVMALCVLPALVIATRPVANPLILEGQVYCDTCRAGFETSATTPIAGAKVRVECKDRKTEELLYTIDSTTDSTGKYKIVVREDHGDQLCDCNLVSSPQSDCATVDPGRDRARVILTRNNGMASNNRFANAMGFMRDQPMSGCHQLLQQYQQEYED